MRLSREDSLLLVIDIQRKLAPAIQDHERVTARTEALVGAAELFDIPKLITEHCPHQIGPLIEPLRSRFAPDEIFEKTAFSATDHPEFLERLARTGRRQVVGNARPVPRGRRCRRRGREGAAAVRAVPWRGDRARTQRGHQGEKPEAPSLPSGDTGFFWGLRSAVRGGFRFIRGRNALLSTAAHGDV